MFDFLKTFSFSLWEWILSIMPGWMLEGILYFQAVATSWRINLDKKTDFPQRYEKLVKIALSNMGIVRILSDPNPFDWSSALHNRHLPELVTLDVTQDPGPAASDLILLCPNLRACILHHLPTQQLITPSLRRLAMRGKPAIPNSVSVLLDILRSIPRLEELELELCAKERLVWNDDQGSSVTLAHLQSIILIGTQDSDMTGFWRKLDLPSRLEYMRIHYKGKAERGPIIDTFAPYLAREPYNALVFRRGENGGLELCAFVFDQDDLAACNPSAPRRGTYLEILSRYYVKGDDVEEGEDLEDGYLDHVLPAMLLPLKARAEQITHLFFATFNRIHQGWMAGPTCRVRDMLCKELGAFTSVTAVFGAYYSFEFDLLGVSIRQGRSPELLPNLTTLVARIEPTQVPLHWEELHTVFTSRARAKIPIRRLELIGPMLPDENYQRWFNMQHEGGLAWAKSIGLQEFVDRRVPWDEWDALGPGFQFNRPARAY